MSYKWVYLFEELDEAEKKSAPEAGTESKDCWAAKARISPK